MHKCNFCRRQDFASHQSVVAHLKHCLLYRQHKQDGIPASGTSLRQAVPKARVPETMSSPVQSPPLPPGDPLAAFMQALQGGGVLPPQVADTGTQETPQQKRRRWLQTAKMKAVDQYWSFTATVTAEMRAAAKLAIDRELRNEPLEELSLHEVSELAGGIRDRIYTAFLRQQEQDARRIKEVEERKRIKQSKHERTQYDAERTHQERQKKKAAILNEAHRRILRSLKTCPLSPLERLQAMADMCSQLDETLTGGETLSEAFAAIDAVLRGRIAEWNAYEAAKEAKRQEEWWEIAMVIAVVSALIFMYIKAPEIFNWFLNIFSPKPAENPGSAPTPSPEAPSQPSEAQVPQPPRRRRVRRSPQSTESEPLASSSGLNIQSPSL